MHVLNDPLPLTPSFHWNHLVNRSAFESDIRIPQEQFLRFDLKVSELCGLLCAWLSLKMTSLHLQALAANQQ